MNPSVASLRSPCADLSVHHAPIYVFTMAEIRSMPHEPRLRRDAARLLLPDGWNSVNSVKATPTEPARAERQRDELRRRIHDVAASCADADLVVVFGSVATGRALPWSDVDVAVRGVSPWRGLEIAAEVGRALGREPHPIDLATTSDHLAFEIARHGVLVHEAIPGTWAWFQAEAAVAWFDLEPIVKRCAAGVARTLARERGARQRG